MGFISNIFLKKQDREIIKEREEFHEEAVNSKNKQPNFIAKIFGSIRYYGFNRDQLVYPEYDFNQIRLASECDSYIKMAHIRQSNLIYKAGYTLKGENDAAVEYIKKRFRIMGIASNIPMDTLFQQTADDLLRFSNAFLLKNRSQPLIYNGNIKARGIYKDSNPVSCYMRLDPCHIAVNFDKYGTIKEYVYQVPGQKDQKIKPQDIIHFYLDKEANKTFGTPRLCATLEDVKTLRRIEGGVLALLYRFAMPIYQWKVGLPQQGFTASDKEITELTNKVHNMEIDGCIITNERTDVKVVGADGNALNAAPYLQYFEKRVFSALGMSESQMGRGTSKQNADSLESQQHDDIKKIQKTLAIFYDNMMIMELLIEGGFDPINKESDIVQYVFNEISLDTKIKLENHEMLKYQSNLITLEEARHEIGKNAECNEADLYWNRVELANAKSQIKAKADAEIEVLKYQQKLAPDDSVTGVQGNGTQKNVSSGAKNQATSINTPSNQHGTTSVKIKESEDTKSTKSRKMLEKYTNLFDIYLNIRDDIVINKSDLDIVLTVGKTKLLDAIYAHMISEADKGAIQSVFDFSHDKNLNYKNGLSIEPIMQYSKIIVDGIFDDIKSNCVDNDYDKISEAFDKYKYRLEFLVAYVMPKTYWYIYTKTSAALGVKRLYVWFNSDTDKKDHKTIIDTSSFDLDDIPAFHSFCQCKLSMKKKGGTKK